MVFSRMEADETEQFWKKLLEGEPEALYHSFRPQYGRGQGRFRPGQERYFKGQFGDVWNEYLGKLGQQIRGGQEPSLQFSNFLEAFPWANRYSSLPPELRGETNRRFAPPVRWLNF